MKDDKTLIQECRNCIHTSPLFEGLDEASLGYFTQSASQGFFRRSESIFKEGDNIQHISFVKTGLLKLYVHGEDGREQIISLARPNDCVGLLSVFSNTHYQYSLRALEPSVLFFVDLAAVKYVLNNDGAFGVKLLGRISRIADRIINKTFENNRKNVRGRIAGILLDFAGDIYHSNEFEMPVSRKEVGELIGMTTENVIRILSEFRKDGLIEIEGKTIRILDPVMMERLQKHG